MEQASPYTRLWQLRIVNILAFESPSWVSDPHLALRTRVPVPEREVLIASGWDMCKLIFNAALFTTTKIWRQPGCPSMDEWIRKKLNNGILLSH